MQINMEDVLSNLPLEILQGNRMVEVRHQGVNKSSVLEAVLRMVEPHGLDFVFCVGDDRSDEDMFQLLKSYQSESAAAASAFNDPPAAAAAPPPPPPREPTPPSSPSEALPPPKAPKPPEGKTPPTVYMVHIGSDATQAEYFLESVGELRKLLRGMSSLSQKDEILRPGRGEEAGRRAVGRAQADR